MNRNKASEPDMIVKEMLEILIGFRVDMLTEMTKEIKYTTMVKFRRLYANQSS